MPSRRQERVSKRIVQELVDALRNLKNASPAFTTITRAEVSPDLRHAKVFISVWGSDEDKQRAFDYLRRNASKLRGMIGRPLGLKMTPELHFEMDDTLETADRISRLIRDARQTDANPDPLTPEEAALMAEAAAAETRNKERKALSSAPAEADPFEEARHDVEEELFEDDDPAWRPINLDELTPEDEE